MSAADDLKAAKELQAALSDFPWGQLTEEQKQNWIQFSRGDVDWDGNVVSTPDGKVVDLARKRGHR